MEQRGGRGWTPEDEARLQRQEHTVRSSQEAQTREQEERFSTRLENSVIANMAEIGVYAFAVYSVIKMYANQENGDSSPSYAEIARMTGMNRTTVIRGVKTLTEHNLLSPAKRYKEDGSPSSNLYTVRSSTPETHS